MCDECRTAHQILNDIGLPDTGQVLPQRIIDNADRLCLRPPEGEPDTADLVGKINELCDAVGMTEGDPALRVSMLAKRCEVQAERIGYLESDLAAERAQLAAAAKPEQWSKPFQSEPGPCDDVLLCDFTRLLLKDTAAAHEFIALARLAARIHAALKEEKP